MTMTYSELAATFPDFKVPPTQENSVILGISEDMIETLNRLSTPDLPLSEMADKGYANMPGWAGYILHELKTAFGPLLEKLEGKASKADITNLWKACERAFLDKREVTSLQKSLEIFAKREDLRQLSEQLGTAATKAELSSSISGIRQSLNSYAAKEDVVPLLARLALLVPREELVNSLSLIAEQLDALKVQTLEVTLTAAQLNNAFTAPIKLLDAPCAGSYIALFCTSLFLDYGTTPYTVGSGYDLSLYFDEGSEILGITSAGLLDQSADQRLVKNVQSYVPVAAKAVYLKTLIGNLADGDSPVTLKLRYRTLPI